jgi:hypothetical protein
MPDEVVAPSPGFFVDTMLAGPPTALVSGGTAAVATSSPDDLDTGCPAPAVTGGRRRR